MNRLAEVALFPLQCCRHHEDKEGTECVVGRGHPLLPPLVLLALRDRGVPNQDYLSLKLLWMSEFY